MESKTKDLKLAKKPNTNKSKSKIGYIIGISVLSVMSVVFMGLYIFSGIQAKGFSTSLENMYRRSFNELNGTVTEMEVKLSKTIASSSKTAKSNMLTDMWKDSNIASEDLGMMPYSENGLTQTVKFINQFGAYCNFLANKIDNGQSLTVEDEQMLEKLHDFLITLKFDLSTITQSISSGNYNIIKNLNMHKFESSDFFNNFSNLESNTIDTPQLIYDGPFSENQAGQDPKGLPAEVYTEPEIKEFVSKIFDNEKIASITQTGKSENHFVTFNYEIKFADKKIAYVEITEKGKLLVQLSRYVEVAESQNLDIDKCIAFAEAFVSKLGLKDVKGVWASDSENVTYVNVCPVINDIVMYPDLIKIKVSKADGTILGYESKAYIYNHIDRTEISPKITIGEAETKVHKNLTVKNKRTCIIPKKYGKEVLAYEFEAEYKGYTYYAYINAVTGEEEDLFRVIETTEGKLLM